MLKRLLITIKTKLTKKLSQEEILQKFEEMDRDLFVADIKIQSEIQDKFRYLHKIKQVRNEVTEIKKELKNEIIKSQKSSTRCSRTKHRS